MGDPTVEDDDDLTLRGTSLEELLLDAQRAAQAAKQMSATHRSDDDADELRPTRALPTVRPHVRAREHAAAGTARREPVTLPVTLSKTAVSPADKTITIPAHLELPHPGDTPHPLAQPSPAQPAADQTVTIPARIDRALLDATQQLPVQPADAPHAVDKTVTIPARLDLALLDAAHRAHTRPTAPQQVVTHNSPQNHAPGTFSPDPDATMESPADLVPLLASHGGTHVLTHEDGWLEFIVEVDENKSLIVPIELARRGLLKPGMQLRVLARLMNS